MEKMALDNLENITWHETDAQSAMNRLQVQSNEGLADDCVHRRQGAYGKNMLQPPKKAGLPQKIIHQLKDVSIIVLLAAVGLSFILAYQNGDGFIEPFVILAVVVLNITLAINQEGKAEKALESLEKLNAPECTAVRGGTPQVIQSSDLVPGDIILLETGCVIPADARLIEAVGLFSDESALTGESEPSEKDASAMLAAGAPLGDQRNMAFAGCVVTAGRAKAVVTATGMGTQMGRIAGFLNTGRQEKTPLQKRLDGLGKAICWIAVISALILLIVGLLGDAGFVSMLMVAVSLAVAVVPETLSLIVTLSLTNGVQRMVGKNALIRKLPAVETLGNTSVICSDKTGTLTQNRMAIKRLWVSGSEPIADNEEFSHKHAQLIKMLAMAGNAATVQDENGNTKYIGSATETAMLRLFNDKGYSMDEMSKQYRRVAEAPFSSERKKSSIVLEGLEGGYAILTMGALDHLPLDNGQDCNIEAARRVHDELAAGALRVIALAGKRIDSLPGNGDIEGLEFGETLIGLVGIIDPPRPEAAAAIKKAKDAGIRTVMITGDHAATAGAIARDLGILQEGQGVMTGARLAVMPDDELNETVRDYSVYARVSPEDKIRIVKAWQANGEVVAMTGDGVNDAPALKAADIGIAMGKAGTEVAKGASDMVLTDDKFSTIVEAVSEGRNVYGIVKKIIYFLLVCNLSEILIMLFGQIAGWGIILTPIILLLINILGDGIPGINLAKEKSDPGLMGGKPVRRDEGFFTAEMLFNVARQTINCALAVLLGYFIGAFVGMPGAMPASAAIGQTMAFLICGWTSILHIFNARSSKSVFKTPVLDNKPLVASAAVMALAIGLAAALPIGGLFGLATMSWAYWLLAIGMALVPTALREINLLIDNIPFVMERRKARKAHMAKASQRWASSPKSITNHSNA